LEKYFDPNFALTVAAGAQFLVPRDATGTTSMLRMGDACVLVIDGLALIDAPAFQPAHSGSPGLTPAHIVINGRQSISPEQAP
jgi:hypothetical protein